MKNACVRRLNSSTSSFLKDWSSSFILKASLQVLFFGMERHTLFETKLDFAESLSIRCCKVFQNFQENLVLIYGLHLYHTSFFAGLKFATVNNGANH